MGVQTGLCMKLRPMGMFSGLVLGQSHVSGFMDVPKMKARANESDQCLKCLLCESGDLSSSPEVHVKVKELSSDHHTPSVAHTPCM